MEKILLEQLLISLDVMMSRGSAWIQVINLGIIQDFVEPVDLDPILRISQDVLSLHQHISHDIMGFLEVKYGSYGKL